MTLLPSPSHHYPYHHITTAPSHHQHHQHHITSTITMSSLPSHHHHHHITSNITITSLTSHHHHHHIISTMTITSLPSPSHHYHHHHITTITITTPQVLWWWRQNTTTPTPPGAGKLPICSHYRIPLINYQPVHFAAPCFFSGVLYQLDAVVLVRDPRARAVRSTWKIPGELRYKNRFSKGGYK